MDVADLSRRAERVSGIFNALAAVVAVLGGFAAAIFVVSAFTSGLLGQRLLWGLAIAAYTILIWAAIQLSSLIAGYIHTRTRSDI